MKIINKNMIKKYAKSDAGFTIIELIVVIAIIAVLASIVLLNVTSYINKGKNTTIKANLSGVSMKGTVYFESDPTYKGSYQSFCTSPTVSASQTAITNAGGTNYTCTCDIASCGSNSTKWCACAQEITSTGVLTFCVDSSGYKKETTTACSSRCTAGVCTD